MLKHILGVLSALVLSIIAPPVVQSSQAETPRERGAYLVRGPMACGNCHTPKGPDGVALADRELAGGLVLDEKPFRAVVPNITPDRATGIGAWTDQQIIDALRNEKRPDGSLIGPPMPTLFYRGLSDSDARAVVAYLRSVKPVANRTEKSVYRIQLPSDWGPDVTHVADVPRGPTAAYGRYLADIAHCMECHTPMTPSGLDTGHWGAGGRELPAFTGGRVISPNLTPANPDGIAHWTAPQIKRGITKGVRPDGRPLVRTMAFDWYRSISPADLDALVAYLRTLKPATS